MTNYLHQESSVFQCGLFVCLCSITLWSRSKSLGKSTSLVSRLPTLRHMAFGLGRSALSECPTSFIFNGLRFCLLMRKCIRKIHLLTELSILGYCTMLATKTLKYHCIIHISPLCKVRPSDYLHVISFILCNPIIVA